MREKPPIIWIEADRPPARYFLNSIKIHQELFPARRKIVVTNSRFAREYRKYPVEIIEIEFVKPSNLTIKFESISKKWTHNRQQLIYWKNTTKRFFYLYDALFKLKISKSIHLEGDNILLDLSFFDALAKKNMSKIAYPKQSSGVGCASVLYVDSLNALKEFLRFINLNWKRGDITDMCLLGEFAEKGKNAEYLNSDLNNLTKSKSIFDPVIIGRYFLGNDSRNFRFPSSKRGIIDSATESFDPSYCLLTKDRERGVVLENFVNGQSLKIANVHIHSKRIPNKYSKLENMMLAESNCNRSKTWKLGKIDFLVLIERTINYLIRNLGHTKNEIRFR